MLFKMLGFITSFGNIAVISALFYHDTIGNFGSVHWNIAIGSMIFLSIISTSFFYLNNKKEGISALKIYGGIYTTLGLLVYGYWGFRNLYYSIKMEEFSGLFLIFSTLLVVGFLAIRKSFLSGSIQVLSLLSSLLSIVTVAMSFATIYKYVIAQAPFNFDNLILELFAIFVGSILFISTHWYVEKNK